MKLTLLFAGTVAFTAMACSTTATNDEGVVAELRSTTCSPEQLAQMVNQPMTPGSIGGLNIGGDGITYGQAEAQLCTGSVETIDDELAHVRWGDAGEVQADWNRASGKIEFLYAHLGYRGILTARSRSGGRFGVHTYTFGIGQPILRDGIVFDLSWRDPDLNRTAANELYDALTATFAPDRPAVDDCIAAGECLVRVMFGAEGPAIFGARPLGTYFHVASTLLPMGESRPDFVYMIAR